MENVFAKETDVDERGFCDEWIELNEWTRAVKVSCISSEFFPVFSPVVLRRSFSFNLFSFLSKHENNNINND